MLSSKCLSEPLFAKQDIWAFQSGLAIDLPGYKSFLVHFSCKIFSTDRVDISDGENSPSFELDTGVLSTFNLPDWVGHCAWGLLDELEVYRLLRPRVQRNFCFRSIIGWVARICNLLQYAGYGRYA